MERSGIFPSYLLEAIFEPGCIFSTRRIHTLRYSDSGSLYGLRTVGLLISFSTLPFLAKVSLSHFSSHETISFDCDMAQFDKS